LHFVKKYWIVIFKYIFGVKMGINHLKKFREEIMLSKAELARKAKISSITIDRIENGMPCRLETMRKIIHGLGKTLSDKNKIFPND